MTTHEMILLCSSLFRMIIPVMGLTSAVIMIMVMIMIMIIDDPSAAAGNTTTIPSLPQPQHALDADTPATAKSANVPQYGDQPGPYCASDVHNCLDT